jgi:hypothetical protein
MGKNNNRFKRGKRRNKRKRQDRPQLTLPPAALLPLAGAPAPPFATPPAKPAPTSNPGFKHYYYKVRDGCVKGKNWCEERRQAFLNRTDGILGPMYFPVLVGALLIVGVLYKGVDAKDELKPFVWVENFVLALMAGFSTANYQKTAKKLKELPVDVATFRLNILIWVNAGWFALTVLFTEPTPRLSFIVAIYVTFTIANIIQVTKSSTLETCNARSNALLEGSAFMREENGPTMVAYTLVVIAVVLHTKYRAADRPYLEAFAGGVAAFHLGLSIVKYSLAIGKTDPITSVLNAVEWNEKAAAELNAIPNKSILWKWFTGLCILTVSVVLVGYFHPSVIERIRKVVDHLMRHA